MKRLVVVIIILTLLQTACTATKHSEETTTVGAILPLTGTNARHGELAQRGIKMALKETNTSVNIVYRDSAFQPDQAVTAYNHITRAHDPAAILALGSPVGMALAPKAENDTIPLLTVAAAPKYSTIGDYVFRIVGSATVEATRVIDVMTEKLNHSRIAVLYMKNNYGVATKQAFLNAVGKDTVVEVQGFHPSASDYRTQLSKIKQARPDIIYVPSLGGEAGRVIKQARELGINASFICPQACQNEDLIRHAGPAAEGTHVVAPTDAANPGFARRYEQRYDEQPDFVSMRFYDATRLLINASQECRGATNTQRCIKQALHRVDGFPGVSYPIRFDAEGDINDQFVWKTVRNGTFVPH